MLRLGNRITSSALLCAFRTSYPDDTQQVPFADDEGVQPPRQQQEQEMIPQQQQYDSNGGKLGRERAREHEMAGQFASLEGGWQAGQDPRFDLFVEEKRRQQAFEEFDQRVQRAFGRAVRQHRTEVWNGFKRQLKRTGDKLTPTLLEDVNRAVNEREEWLRDRFTQIDADYRSNDVERRNRAAAELRAALDGRSGELLESHYESKLERRLAGPKKGRVLEQQQEEDELAGAGPGISNDEVNRYSNLKPNVAAIEDAVVSRYGRAGREHWDVLQSEKDAEYGTKLRDAAKIYEGLLDQAAAYEQSEGNRPLKDYVRRISRMAVRFRSALEVEATREELIEAHEAMQRRRRDDAEQRRLARHRAAQEMRARGVPDAEIRASLKSETLNQMNADLAQQVAMEKDEARSRKRVFMQMVDQLEYDVDRAEGEREMAMTSGSSQEQAQAMLRDKARQMSDPQIQEVLNETADLAAQRGSEALSERQAPRGEALGDEQTSLITKRALWDVLNRDTWEDPFSVVHSARMQAAKTYDEIYAHAQPSKLRLGKKANRGMGQNVVAGKESKMLQDPQIEANTFLWGMRGEDMHLLDEDGTNKWVRDAKSWHMRDPETRDVDQRYEKKLGRGARWMGPTFYKRGIDAQDKDSPSKRPAREDPNAKRPKVKASMWSGP